MYFRILTLFIVVLLSTAQAQAQTGAQPQGETAASAPVATAALSAEPPLKLHTGKKIGYGLLTSTLTLGGSYVLLLRTGPLGGVAGLIGSTLATAGVVHAIGHRHGGEGRFRASLAGATLGFFGGVAAGALLGSIAFQTEAYPLLFFAALCIPAGPALGAALAHNASERRQRAISLSVAFVPVKGGLTSGLVGRF